MGIGRLKFMILGTVDLHSGVTDILFTGNIKVMGAFMFDLQIIGGKELSGPLHFFSDRRIRKKEGLLQFFQRDQILGQKLCTMYR